MLRRFTGLCVILVLCHTSPQAQTLAHPGWRGNGIASQAWWKHASFVRLGPAMTFAEAAQALDNMADAGVDTMILPDLQPPADAAAPFSERFGTEDDLDTLLREGSARHMHVLVTMPVSRLSVGGGEVRFWMTRGISGVDAGSVSPGDLSVLRGVRSAMAHFPGERILLAQTAPPSESRRGDDARRDPVTLHVVDSAAAPSSKVDPQAWQAIEITSWDSPAPPSSAHTALIFASRLLQQQGGPAKARAMISQRATRRAR